DGHVQAFTVARSVEHFSLAESRARVKTVVDGPQPRFEHVRVDLRGREVGVAQHHLDGAQIGAALEQVRGERVTNDMGTERWRQSGAPPVGLENLPEADAAERSASRVDEQSGRRAIRGLLV